MGNTSMIATDIGGAIKNKIIVHTMQHGNKLMTNIILKPVRYFLKRFTGVITRLFFILLILHPLSSVYGQDNTNAKEYKIYCKNVVFISANEKKEFTLKIGEEGQIYFQREFLENNFFPKGMQIEILKSQMDVDDRVFRNVKIQGTDTIIDYFQKTDIKIKDYLRLRYSYILQFFNSKCNNNNETADYICTVYPCPTAQYLNEYCFVKIRKEASNYKLISMFGISEDSVGFKVTRSDSLLLPDKQVKKLEKQLAKVRLTNLSCVLGYYTWFMETSLSGKHTTCMIGNCHSNADKKQLRENGLFHAFLGNINSRHFTDCYRHRRGNQK